MRQVYLIELTCVPGIRFSLAAAYLEAYARFSGASKSKNDFHRFTAYLGNGFEQIIGNLKSQIELHRHEPAVVCFTIYFWNRAASLRLARWLKRIYPACVTVFGGNDVLGQSQEPLWNDPSVDVVCFGEGERVFVTVLDALEERSPRQLTDLPGVACRLSTGAISAMPCSMPRLQDLDEIPSPFLTGVVTASEVTNSRVIILETNRGCPYSCAFCYWGGAINTTVRRFSSARLTAELDYICKYISQNSTLFLADANFGMSRQDLAFARDFVAALDRHGKKAFLFVNWAKNTTQRVIETAKVLFEGQIITSVTLSAQSLSENALLQAKRQNIRFEYYAELQRQLSRLNIPTYTELIAGLPGETYDEFMRGLSRIIGTGGHPVIYPLLLLNNTEFATEERRTRHQFRTRMLRYQPTDTDPSVEVVVGHKELSEIEWLRLLDIALVMALFRHTLFRCLLGVLGNSREPHAVLERILEAISTGRVNWSARAQHLFDNHRATWISSDHYDQPAVQSVLGKDFIEDHVHFQAIVHVICDDLCDDPISLARLARSLTDAIDPELYDSEAIQRAISNDFLFIGGLTRIVRSQRVLEDRRLDEDLPRFGYCDDVAPDTLLLAIYHGSLTPDRVRPREVDDARRQISSA